MRNLKLHIFAASFICLIYAYSPVKAAEMKISVPQASVYKEANTNSEVITTVYKGDTVKVSNKSYPGFQKVMVGSQVGYISNTDLRGTLAGGKRTMSPQKRGAAGGTLRNRMSLGLYAGVNYQTQGTRTGVDASGITENFGVMSGFGTRFGASLQFGLSPRLSGKVYGEMKSVSVTGTGSTSLVSSIDMFLKEQFIAIGLLGQYYFGNRFWGGVGGEYDLFSTGTFKEGGTESALTPDQRVSFFYMFGAIGYDFPLSQKLFLVTDARLGALFSRPLILEGDFTISFAYAF